jgi:hypothetical protein
MSNALAIAAVSEVLRSRIESWLVDQNANAALGGANADVTTVAPDTIELTGPNATARLNLFLYQVTPNAGWRNVDLASRNARGDHVSSPPLALDLHYLLTAYGPQPLQQEVLLGYGMQLLHEAPVLGREEIEGRLPAALAPSNLGRQVEQIRVTPAVLGSEEMSKLWSALQARYRPSAAYHVSVVLIDAPVTGSAPLPVLTRDIRVLPDTMPALPAITAVRPPASQPGATLGDTVTVEGHYLDGADRAVRIENRQLGIEREIAALPGAESGLLRFLLPNLPADLPAGIYSLRALVQRPGEAQRRESNLLTLAILPSITTALPLNVARDATRTAVVNLACTPQVRPHQRATLVLGAREVLANPFNSPTAALTFELEEAPLGSYLARLRVDGLDSLIVNATATPPTFFNRRIVIA